MRQVRAHGSRREPLRRRPRLRAHSGRHRVQLRAARGAAGGVSPDMRRRSKLLIIVLLVLTAAVIVFALFFMGQEARPEHVSRPTGGRTAAWNPALLWSGRWWTLTPENVQSVLAELNRAENYSCTETVEDHWLGRQQHQPAAGLGPTGAPASATSGGGSMRNVSSATACCTSGSTPCPSSTPRPTTAAPTPGCACSPMRTCSSSRWRTSSPPATRSIPARSASTWNTSTAPITYVNRIYVSVSHRPAHGRGGL